MPAYDYDCSACGRRFEVIHGVHADRPTSCPLCGGGPVRRAISAPAVHYRGSGWAKKERRSGAGSPASKATDGTSSSGDASSGDPSPPTDGATTTKDGAAPAATKAAPAKGESGASTSGD